MNSSKARGADAFRNLIERSEDHNAFRIEQIAAKYDLEDDEARVLFLRDAARMLAGIESTPSSARSTPDVPPRWQA